MSNPTAFPHLQNFSPKMTRAWMHALFHALNRDAQEITIEDELVGVHQEFGDAVLRYFDPESAALEFIIQIRQSARAHNYGLSNIGELAKKEMETKGGAVSFRGLPMSESLKLIFAAAEAYSQAQQHHSIGLRDLIRAMAEDAKVARILKEQGIEFRKDIESVASEAASIDEAGIIPLEEVIRIFKGWMKTSARVMCVFRSGAGSIHTSLGALFHITGKVGNIVESHAQICIDAENATEASCLLDLRGSSARREVLNQREGDTRMGINPLTAIDIRLATGDHCTITSLPPFVFGGNRETTSHE